MLDTSIPGFAQIDEWPTPPTYPVTIVEFDRYRDGGPQGGFAVLVDADQNRYLICFDGLLGRLCFGGTHTGDENVAFVRVGSPLESSIITILESFTVNNPNHPKREHIESCMDVVHHWSRAN